MSAPAPKACIITGGASGIGRACAERFARAGYRIAILDLKTPEGGAGLALACDVADPAACDDAVRRVLSSFGRIDALIANAGVQTPGRALDTPMETWDGVLNINLKGVFNICRATLPAMAAQSSGAIVIVASTSALASSGQMTAYDASKAGLLGLSRSLAAEHGGDGVRVNAICPGATLTDHHLKLAAARGQSEEQLRERTKGYGMLGRIGEPIEIANAIHFLASDEASFITGATLVADGGATARGL